MSSSQQGSVKYSELVQINSLLRQLIIETDSDVKNICNSIGVTNSSKDGGNYEATESKNVTK